MLGALILIAAAVAGTTWMMYEFEKSRYSPSPHIKPKTVWRHDVKTVTSRLYDWQIDGE